MRPPPTPTSVLRGVTQEVLGLLEITSAEDVVVPRFYLMTWAERLQMVCQTWPVDPDALSTGRRLLPGMVPVVAFWVGVGVGWLVGH